MTLVLLILFLVTNGARFYRWCKNRGYSLNCAKILSKKNKEKTIEPMTHANPHTESPKLQTKKPNNNYNRSSSVFSGTVTGELLMTSCIHHLIINVFICRN